MMRTTLASLFCVAGVLSACSGRFEVGAVGSAGGSAGGAGELRLGPAQAGSTANATGGSASGGGASTSETAAKASDNVRSAACGVGLGQPAEIAEPITDRREEWWDRAQRLIWKETRDPPLALPPSITHALAGEMVDAAIDEAIAETGGIPAAEGFVNHWLKLEPDGVSALANGWSALLGGEAPAPTVLLLTPYDDTRTGAFTEQTFLVAYPTISERGYVMAGSVFGLEVPPEPEAVVHPGPPPGVTRREWLDQDLNNPVCRGCHTLIDPLGYALENFDALGNYTTTDAGKPVNTAGTLEYLAMDEPPLEYSSIVDLSLQLHERCDVNLAFADRFLMYALKLSNVPNSSLDAHPIDRARLQQAFIRSGRSYRSLIKAFAQSLAIRDHIFGAR